MTTVDEVMALVHRYGSARHRLHDMSQPFTRQMDADVKSLESAIRAALEAMAGAAGEGDELIRSLGYDPERFRTDGGSINHMKLAAAIKHPADYAGLALLTAPDSREADRRDAERPGKREVIFWRYIRQCGLPYKWNEGAPTDEDRRNTIIGEHIQLAYSE